MSSQATTVLDHVFKPIRVGRMNLKNRLSNPSHSGGRGALIGDEEMFQQFLDFQQRRLQGLNVAISLGHRAMPENVLAFGVE